jgi:hypothetical protein
MVSVVHPSTGLIRTSSPNLATIVVRTEFGNRPATVS